MLGLLVIHPSCDIHGIVLGVLRKNVLVKNNRAFLSFQVMWIFD
jgi:hypothetical protein